MSTAPQLSYANVGSSLDKVTTLGLAPGRKPMIVDAKPKPKAAAPKAAPVVQQQPVADLSAVGKPVEEVVEVEEEKPEQPKIKRTSGYAIVKAVLSGDTLVVLGAAPAGTTVIPEKVITISGITAPKFGRGKAGVDEPFGWEAREFLRKKIIGAQVQFSIQHTSESGRDYGVVKLNGVDLAQEIVRAGYAEVKRGKNDKIPTEKESLHQLQQEADALGVGKWRLKHLSDDQKQDVIRKIRWDEDNKLLYQRSKGIPLPAIIDQVRDGSTFRVEIHGLNGLQHDIITLHLAGVQCPRTPLPKSVRDSNAAAAADATKPVEEDTSDDIAAATKIDKKAKKDKAKKGEKKEEEAPKKKEAKKEPAPAAAPARPPRQPQPVDDEGEPFGIEAQQFVEARLLHRDVHVILQGLDKFNNVFGSIQYPKGNIAGKLLELGYGKYVPWSAQITTDAQKLKEAEASAKKNHLRLWQNYVEPADAASFIPEYIGKVIQVHSGDTITVTDANDEKREQKVSLASITAPKLGVRGAKDEPFAVEAKEFLRSRLIGHKVKIVNEYTRAPPKDSMDQSVRQYVSLFSIANKANISEQILSAGLAEVVRHGKNEDRSVHYEEYVGAENRAKELKKGKHGGATGPAPERVVDLSIRGPAPSESKESGGRKGSTASTGGDSKLAVAARQSHARAQNAFTKLKDQKQLNAIVEHAFSGARVKLYIPSEKLLIAFALAGVKVPAAKTKDGKSSDEHAALGAQALQFTRSRILQHNVKVDIEALDKGSNFIGNLFTSQKQNLAELLLSEGLAEIFEYSVKNNQYKDALKAAEESAKHAHKGVFKNWTPSEDVESETPQESKEFKEGAELIKITVTEIIDAATFFAQIVDDKNLEHLQQTMAAFAENVPEQDESLKVTPGKLYAGQFTVDDAWYRVRVEGRSGDEFRVFFVDYGNHDLLDVSRLRELPAELTKLPDSAHLCFLAGIQAPKNEEYRETAISAFTDLVWERQLLAKVEATEGYGRDRRLHVTLQDESNETSVNTQLVRDGFVRVATRVPGKLKELQTALLADEKIARDAHYNMWEYGDVDDDGEEQEQANKRR